MRCAIANGQSAVGNGQWWVAGRCWSVFGSKLVVSSRALERMGLYCMGQKLWGPPPKG